MKKMKQLMNNNILKSLALLTLLSPACGEDDPVDGGGGNEEEVITTVVLTFTPNGGGETVVAEFNDADGDGGDAPVVDAIELPGGVEYTLSVGFENRLETPAEDITEEIEDESDEHQVFFTGDIVNSPASDPAESVVGQAYLDADANGLPIGLENTFDTSPFGGTGTLTVTLRHLQPVNGVAVKVDSLAQTVLDSGFGALAGDTDVQVDFPVTIGVAAGDL